MLKVPVKNILRLLAVSFLIWVMWKLEIFISQIGEESRPTAMIYYHILMGCIYGYIGILVYFQFKKNKNKYNQDIDSSEKRYRLIIDNSPLGIVQFDKTGVITESNDKCIEILDSSKDRVIGLNLLTQVNNNDMKLAIQSALVGKVSYYEGKYTTVTSGKTIALKAVVNGITSESGDFLGGVGILEDVTEKKKIEREMARLDRLHLVGQMSASIGHEVRNPMTTVRGFLQLLGKKETDAIRQEYYELMISELDRANKIITEFLSLAKNKLVKLESVNINDIIDSLYPLILGDAIHNEKNILLKRAHIPNITVDETEIRQLILNLVRNGLEAMPKGKSLIIRTYTERNELVLAVQDEGPGISADVLDKIGTPFLTTKETGTGLGLAVCYSIAERHHAKMDFKTDLSGTTFFVRFKISKPIGSCQNADLNIKL